MAGIRYSLGDNLTLPELMQCPWILSVLGGAKLDPGPQHWCYHCLSFFEGPVDSWQLRNGASLRHILVLGSTNTFLGIHAFFHFSLARERARSQMHWSLKLWSNFHCLWNTMAGVDLSSRTWHIPKSNFAYSPCLKICTILPLLPGSRTPVRNLCYLPTL